MAPRPPPGRFTSGAFPVVHKTIKNLYLAGCDVGCLGINGSMMGGVMTASLLVGSGGYPRLLAASRRARPSATIVDPVADRPVGAPR